VQSFAKGGSRVPYAAHTFSYALSMTTTIRSRPRLGDIIEISTPQGLAFAQFTHEHVQYGALLNVLSGTFAARPDAFEALLDGEPQFSTFFPLNAACARGIVRIVASERIPASAAAFPTFRTAIKGKDGAWGPWWLWDGEREWQVGTLKSGMESLPPRGVVNDTLLVERIIAGWRHEHWL